MQRQWESDNAANARGAHNAFSSYHGVTVMHAFNYICCGRKLVECDSCHVSSIAHTMHDSQGSLQPASGPRQRIPHHIEFPIDDAALRRLLEARATCMLHHVFSFAWGCENYE